MKLRPFILLSALLAAAPAAADALVPPPPNPAYANNPYQQRRQQLREQKMAILRPAPTPPAPIVAALPPPAPPIIQQVATPQAPLRVYFPNPQAEPVSTVASVAVLDKQLSAPAPVDLAELPSALTTPAPARVALPAPTAQPAPEPVAKPVMLASAPVVADAKPVVEFKTVAAAPVPPDLIAALEPAAGGNETLPVQTVTPATEPVAAIDAQMASEPPPTLSTATQKTLRAIPSRLDAPKKPPKPTKMVLDKTKEPDAGSTSVSEAAGLKIAVRRPPVNVNYELEKAYAALAAGQTEVAISTYDALLQNDPNNQDALFGLATSYHRLGLIDKARPYYSHLLKINPGHREALNNFLSLAATEAPEQTLQELQALAARNPDFSPIPAQMAVIYQKLGRPEEAIDAMMKAVALAPDNITYRYNLALMFDRAGKYPQAANLYKQLIEANYRGEVLPGNVQQIQERLTFISSNRS